jgi:hypothetical protein
MRRYQRVYQQHLAGQRNRLGLAAQDDSLLRGTRIPFPDKVLSRVKDLSFLG